MEERLHHYTGSHTYTSVDSLLKRLWYHIKLQIQDK